MNQEQFTSLLRTALQVGGSVLATRLGIDGDAWESLSAAVVVIAATAWGLYVRRKTGIVASAAALPEVRTVIADPKIADALGPKVRPSSIQ